MYIYIYIYIYIVYICKCVYIIVNIIMFKEGQLALTSTLQTYTASSVV